ncbi:MAG: MipA/OmpV family protein [Gammaproteobacteria bacterium]|nr:MipA/OmpV family protein [Gammaproteobacteria bacterium]MCW9031500.1 MipA/OmpV family protein [Gammaproteobacteria bacterium]
MTIIFFLILFLFSTLTVAEDTPQSSIPKWELGVGIGAISLPHYRGSDQNADYVSPIPYFRYSGKRLQLDKEGGRFYFYNSDEFKFDLSTAFSLPVDSDDNHARTGMNNLGAVIELGPRIQFSLYQSKDKSLRIRFALPLREAFDIGDVKDIGWVFSPYLQLRYFNSGWETATSFGPVWASEEYHDYFYQVAPQYATTTRTAYNAQAGYSGSRLTFMLSKRFGDTFFGLFARYDDLSGATFIDSPLIKQKDSLMIGVALSWVFKKSEKYSQYIVKKVE